MRQQSVVVWLLVLAGCIGSTPVTERLVIEANSPAIDSEGVLVEAIGMETLGGVFTPLLEMGCSVPCEVSEIFSTASDSQDQITISLFRGNVSLVSEATPLGKFRIEGIPVLPRGEPQIEVTFATRDADLILFARDRESGRSYSVVRLEK